jgi:sn-glycerol 3-phosphate transport system ATP-binding protein
VRPATTFVAGFIGSPPMNLLKGQADGTRFTVGADSLPMPAAAPRSGELILGLRPEHAELNPIASESASAGWPLKVEMVEMLGAERLVYARLGETLFTVRVDATLQPPAVGDRVNVHMKAEHLHWFDPVTQGRI